MVGVLSEIFFSFGMIFWMLIIGIGVLLLVLDVVVEMGERLEFGICLMEIFLGRGFRIFDVVWSWGRELCFSVGFGDLFKFVVWKIVRFLGVVGLLF